MHHPAKLYLQLNANTLNGNGHPKSQSLPQLPSSLGIRHCSNSGPHPRPLEVSWWLFLTWQVPESHSKALPCVTLAHSASFLWPVSLSCHGQ